MYSQSLDSIIPIFPNPKDLEGVGAKPGSSGVCCCGKPLRINRFLHVLGYVSGPLRAQEFMVLGVGAFWVQEGG